MRVLYFLEPSVELGNPRFRLATIRNHLDREIRSLAAEPGVEVVLLASEVVIEAARHEGLIEGVRTFSVSAREGKSLAPDSLRSSLAWYDEDYSAELLAKTSAFYARKLSAFLPDVIVVYESNAPFLARLFPDALLLHDTLGIFSRTPYPETSALDPYGIGKHSYVARFGQALRTRVLSPDQASQLALLKERYRAAQLQFTPVEAARVRGDFSRVVLLPLQVSRYFMYDGNCPTALRGRPQTALVEHVLTTLPRDIGVYVTLHRMGGAPAAERRIAALQKRFPNLLFDAKIQALRWPSQHVLPHVDGVVSVSSSVGLQAMIWDLPVASVGHSQLTGIASAPDLSRVPEMLAAGRTRALDPVLYHLLVHYYPLTRRYHHHGPWFAQFMRRLGAWHRGGRIGDPFSLIDDPSSVFAALTEELRLDAYASDMTTPKHEQSSAPSQRDASEIAARIAAAHTVSFDIFDTLVTRPYLEPRALFGVIAPAIARALGAEGVELSTSFSALRERAARAAARDAAARGSEEYDLTAVYNHIASWLETEEATRARLVGTLRRLEEEAEVRQCRPLPDGVSLLRAARAAGKRILLLSDTYLDRVVVEAILASCGISGYDALYVSSEHGVCKRSGALFRLVAEREGGPNPWLHLGDHRLSDELAPERLGIQTHRLPNLSERYLRDAHVRRVWDLTPREESLARLVLHGVISRKFALQGAIKQSTFAGSAYRLGYVAGGPILFGFVQWLAERAHRDGITDLYFLARDGLLPKQCMERLFPAGVAPRLHYLQASRRFYALPALHTRSEVVATASVRAPPVSLGALLEHRYGLVAVDLPGEPWRLHGYAGLTDRIDLREPEQREQFEALLDAVAPEILAHAAQERDVLLAYLAHEGFTDPARRVAVVDIGHHASLQHRLSTLTGRRDIRGYYFATFTPAQAVSAAGLEMASYLLEFEDSKASTHAYPRQVGMFEFLFLPPQPSLVRLERKSGAFEPVYVVGDEDRRMRVAQELHDGVLDFQSDFLHAAEGALDAVQLSKSDAVRSFLSFASSPGYEDAKLLDGVAFVDAFGGYGRRFLLPPAPPTRLRGREAARYVEAAWWKEGARVIARLPQMQPLSELGTHPSWQRKLRKFRRDPTRFVADMTLGKRVKSLLHGLKMRLKSRRDTEL